MYLYLCSDDNKDIHPENSWDDFIVELPKNLELEKDKWEVALVNVFYKPANLIKGQLFYVFANICDYSIARSTTQQILGTFSQRGELANPSYIGVISSLIKTIRISVRNEDFAVDQSESIKLFCTLHFRRKEI